MQEEKIAHAKFVLEQLKEHYGFKTFGKLAEHLGVKQNTLSSWISRGAVDEDRIFRKCEGISFDWVQTGKGEMFPPVVSESGGIEWTKSVTDPVEEAFLNDWRSLSEVGRMRIWTLLKEEKEREKAG